MIRITTGTPGAGKTAFVVSEILFNKDFKDRKVIHNINGLDRENSEFWTKEQFQQWHVDYKAKYGTAQENELERDVLFVIDEVQFVFPNRSSTSTPPDYISMLDIHRHFGLDFILITQDLRKCDPVLRGDTVEEHYHIWDSGLLSAFGIRQKSIFQGVRINPNSSIRTAKKTSFYKPPRKAFKHYRSAMTHTKVKRSMNSVVYVLLGSILCGAYFINKAVNKPSAFQQPDTVVNATGQPVSYNSPVQSEAKPFDASLHVPVDPRYPESAPIYDGNRPLKPMRRIAGCIKSAKACNCYDDEALPLLVPFSTCTDFANHEYYTPYAVGNAATQVAQNGAIVEQNAVPQPAQPQRVDINVNAPQSQPSAAPAADSPPQIQPIRPPRTVAVPVT